MPENISHSDVDIKLNGTLIEDAWRNNIIRVVVDQHALLPAMFTIELYDPEMKFLDGDRFPLADEIEILAVEPDDYGSESGASLIKGEITAIEPDFQGNSEVMLVIRGYDKSHRLFRETKSKAWQNIKDSDLASEIAGNAGLSKQIETTSVVYDHVYQDNQTDLAFLAQRAWRIGFECFVAEGKLYFRKPNSGGAAATLKFGENLVSFRPRMSLAEQVDSVEVLGWDPQAKQSVVGQASSSTLKTSTSAAGGYSNGSSFGTGKEVIVDQPVFSQSEANLMAQARLDERNGTFIEAEGMAINSPNVVAGQKVTLEEVGTKFGGDYLVTAARHSFDVEGWRVHFEVRGLRTGLISEAMGPDLPLKRWPGVVTAVVTQTDDPNDWGRVKVKFPWMNAQAESDWARLIGPGGGKSAGMILIPEVDDEVLVAFEHGDFSRPVVIGGLWNGSDPIPEETAGAGSGEKPLVRAWRSRTGHVMSMYDNAGGEDKVQIKTTDGHIIVLDKKNQKIEITTKGGHHILMDDKGKMLEIKTTAGHLLKLDDNPPGKITLHSIGDMELKAAMNMKINASMNIDIQGGAQVNVKGGMINLN